MSIFDLGGLLDVILDGFDGATVTFGSMTVGDFDEGDFDTRLKEFIGKSTDGACGQDDADEVRSLFDECAARYRFREGGYYTLIVEDDLRTGERTVVLMLGNPLVSDEACVTISLCCDIASDCAKAREEVESDVWFAREGWVEELEAEMAGGAPCR